MLFRDYFILIFILYISAFQIAIARLHFDENEYRSLKRFLFHKATTASTSRQPSVLENLVRPSTTKKTPILTVKSTSSPLYPSSGACASKPCEHGGVCYPKGQLTYECQCVGPWRGIHCNVANACYRSPCQNGGTCLNVYDDYWCKCPSDYYGTNCQTKFHTSSYSENFCQPNPCNTGRCISLKTTYYCQCPDDRYGVHCEKRFSKREHSLIRSYGKRLAQVLHE